MLYSDRYQWFLYPIKTVVLETGNLPQHAYALIGVKLDNAHVHVSLTPITTTRECVHLICTISKVYITYGMKTSCTIHLSGAQSCLLRAVIGQLEKGVYKRLKWCFSPTYCWGGHLSVSYLSFSVACKHVNQILTRWENPILSIAHRFSCACKRTGYQKVTTNVTKRRWNRKSNTANLVYHPRSL